MAQDETRTASRAVGQPRPTSCWSLTLATGPLVGTQTLLAPGDRRVVGRRSPAFERPEALADEVLSREHLELVVEPSGELIARDLSSRNGSFVSGARIERTTLRGGEVLGAGKTLIVVEGRPQTVWRPSSAVPLVCASAAFSEALRSLLDMPGTGMTPVLSGESGVGKTHVARWLCRQRSDDAPIVVHPSEPLDVATFERALREPGPTVIVERLEAQPASVHATLLDCYSDRSDRQNIVITTGLGLSEFLAGGHAPPELTNRLAAGFVRLPPLRERKPDLPTLAMEIVERAVGERRDFDPELMFRVLMYPWPGNLHQLVGALEQCLAFTEADGPLLLSPSLAALLEMHTMVEPLAQRLLRVSEDGSAFCWPANAEPTALRSGSPASRVLLALAARRSARRITAVSAETLVEEVWPGEHLREGSGRNRLYVALSTLRKAGLADAIERSDDGYRLSPSIDVEVAGDLRVP